MHIWRRSAGAGCSIKFLTKFITKFKQEEYLFLVIIGTIFILAFFACGYGIAKAAKMFTPRNFKQEMALKRVENVKPTTEDEYISVKEFEDRYYEEHPIKFNPMVEVDGKICMQDADTKQISLCQ